MSIPNECVPFDFFVVALSAEALDIFLAVALLSVTLLFEYLDGLVEGFYCRAFHLDLLRSKAKENQCTPYWHKLASQHWNAAPTNRARDVYRPLMLNPVPKERVVHSMWTMNMEVRHWYVLVLSWCFIFNTKEAQKSGYWLFSPSWEYHMWCGLLCLKKTGLDILRRTGLMLLWSLFYIPAKSLCTRRTDGHTLCSFPDIDCDIPGVSSPQHQCCLLLPADPERQRGSWKTCYWRK